MEKKYSGTFSSTTVNLQALKQDFYEATRNRKLRNPFVLVQADLQRLTNFENILIRGIAFNQALFSMNFLDPLECQLKIVGLQNVVHVKIVQAVIHLNNKQTLSVKVEHYFVGTMQYGNSAPFDMTMNGCQVFASDHLSQLAQQVQYEELSNAFALNTFLQGATDIKPEYDETVRHSLMAYCDTHDKCCEYQTEKCCISKVYYFEHLQYSMSKLVTIGQEQAEISRLKCIFANQIMSNREETIVISKNSIKVDLYQYKRTYRDLINLENQNLVPWNLLKYEKPRISNLTSVSVSRFCTAAMILHSDMSSVSQHMQLKCMGFNSLRALLNIQVREILFIYNPISDSLSEKKYLYETTNSITTMCHNQLPLIQLNDCLTTSWVPVHHQYASLYNILQTLYIPCSLHRFPLLNELQFDRFSISVDLRIHQMQVHVRNATITEQVSVDLETGIPYYNGDTLLAVPHISTLQNRYCDITIWFE